jgi:hypothetical protein
MGDLIVYSSGSDGDCLVKMHVLDMKNFILQIAATLIIVCKEYAVSEKEKQTSGIARILEQRVHWDFYELVRALKSHADLLYALSMRF